MAARVDTKNIGTRVQLNMNDKAIRVSDPVLGIAIEPEQPVAGANFAISVSARGDIALTDEALVAILLDAEGHELARAPVATDQANGTGQAVLKVRAPSSTGERRWSLCLRAGNDNLAQADVTFDVRAHLIRPIVWGAPSAITANDTFRFHVGLRCSSTCCSASWSFIVEDEDGKSLLSGVTGSTPMPGTDALHCAQVELRAPDREGRYVWRIRPTNPCIDLPHSTAPADLHLNVVRQPDHVIRVVALDAVSRQPVERARVVAHPFRTFTDLDGRAEIAVPAGAYRVFVSGRQYFPFQDEVDVRQDRNVEIVAEMHVDRAFDEVDQWA